jgi:hypothetical protein
VTGFRRLAAAVAAALLSAGALIGLQVFKK